MNQTVQLAQDNQVLIGAHPSLPDHQGFGRREMAIEPVYNSLQGPRLPYADV
jgi:lactam utilization protein B